MMQDVNENLSGAQLGGPWGLDRCPFQQKSDSALFVETSLGQKGHFPYIERAWFQKFSGGFAPAPPHFPFVTLKRDCSEDH